jgi:hypothetical protein
VQGFGWQLLLWQFDVLGRFMGWEGSVRKGMVVILVLLLTLRFSGSCDGNVASFYFFWSLGNFIHLFYVVLFLGSFLTNRIASAIIMGNLGSVWWLVMSLNPGRYKEGLNHWFVDAISLILFFFPCFPMVQNQILSLHILEPFFHFLVESVRGGGIYWDIYLNCWNVRYFGLDIGRWMQSRWAWIDNSTNGEWMKYIKNKWNKDGFWVKLDEIKEGYSLLGWNKSLWAKYFNYIKFYARLGQNIKIWVRSQYDWTRNQNWSIQFFSRWNDVLLGLKKHGWIKHKIWARRQKVWMQRCVAWSRRQSVWAWGQMHRVGIINLWKRLQDFQFMSWRHFVGLRRQWGKPRRQRVKLRRCFTGIRKWGYKLRRNCSGPRRHYYWAQRQFNKPSWQCIVGNGLIKVINGLWILKNKKWREYIGLLKLYIGMLYCCHGLKIGAQEVMGHYFYRKGFYVRPYTVKQWGYIILNWIIVKNDWAWESLQRNELNNWGPTFIKQRTHFWAKMLWGIEMGIKHDGNSYWTKQNINKIYGPENRKIVWLLIKMGFGIIWNITKNNGAKILVNDWDKFWNILHETLGRVYWWWAGPKNSENIAKRWMDRKEYYIWARRHGFDLKERKLVKSFWANITKVEIKWMVIAWAGLLASIGYSVWILKVKIMDYIGNWWAMSIIWALKMKKIVWVIEWAYNELKHGIKELKNKDKPRLEDFGVNSYTVDVWNFHCIGFWLSSIWTCIFMISSSRRYVGCLTLGVCPELNNSISWMYFH